MPQIPFPHVLSSDLEIKKGIMRVVSDQEMKDGAAITEKRPMQYCKKNDCMESVYACYEFNKVNERRPAKGTWTNYGCHPTYYEGVGQMVLKFQSDMPLIP